MRSPARANSFTRSRFGSELVCKDKNGKSDLIRDWLDRKKEEGSLFLLVKTALSALFLFALHHFASCFCHKNARLQNACSYCLYCCLLLSDIFTLRVLPVCCDWDPVLCTHSLLSLSLSLSFPLSCFSCAAISPLLTLTHIKWLIATCLQRPCFF